MVTFSPGIQDQIEADGIAAVSGNHASEAVAGTAADKHRQIALRRVDVEVVLRIGCF